MTEHVELRTGVYYDSISLLRVAQAAAATPGVSAAQVAMATALNLELTAGLGFVLPPAAGPNELLIALRGTDESAISAGLAAIEAAIEAHARPSSSTAGDAPPRTVRSAVVAEPQASIVVISLPGPFVPAEAMDAINGGRHVLIFSDNVSLAHEVALKTAAAAAGVLVMGPDCGTAIIGGVGLGFANAIRAGPVGIVAASGTGAQQLSSLLDEAGVGVSHLIGLGGRDLSAAVGGRSALQAIRLLQSDPATEHIVLVSKPADPAVAAHLVELLQAGPTPFTVVILGPDGTDLTSAAESVLSAVGAVAPVWPSWGSPVVPGGRPTLIRGLFSGGTLADEAMALIGRSVGRVRSNIPLAPVDAIEQGLLRGVPQLSGLGHVVLDLGDDGFTRGRAHPMIDPTLKLQLLQDCAADPNVGVLLLDVVLGHAADPDPARLLAPAVAAAIAAAARSGRELAVVISLCGSAADPQGRDRQAGALAAAGAHLFASNAAAARAAVSLSGHSPYAQPSMPGARAGLGGSAGGGDPQAADQGPVDLLTTPTAVITVGIDLLADALRAQAVPVLTVDWRPPTATPTISIRGVAQDPLSVVLTDPRLAAANQQAATRMLATQALLVDVLPAAEALGLSPDEFCHAGPPISWERASGPLRGALIAGLLLEGLAVDPADAQAKLAGGATVRLSPCHDHHAVGPMAGVITPSMWVFKLIDQHTGAAAYCPLNEGLGKVMRYGAYSPEVIDRLRWMAAVLGPALRSAVRAGPGVDTTAIVGQMIQMGDEGHNRNRAGTLMLLRELLPTLLTSGIPSGDLAEIARFLGGNDHFFLNLVMPTGKLMGDAAADIAGSSVVTAMCRNGTDFGIRVSGTGDEWFTGPANYPQGLFLPGFGPGDANPDIGDSAITETMGIGGMVMAAAPAIVRFVGGAVPDALATTRRMYEITLAENPAFAVPILEFRGAPTGIDVTRVLRTGILPQINTGMAGRVAGTGQVGAGLVNPPMECFSSAIGGLAARV